MTGGVDIKELLTVFPSILQQLIWEAQETQEVQEALHVNGATSQERQLTRKTALLTLIPRMTMARLMQSMTQCIMQQRQMKISID